MMTRSACLVLAATLFTSSPVAAQTYAPLVTMRVTATDGTTQELKARDSNTATLTLKDGTVYEFRPTIQDEPFSKVTVGIFKAPTATESTVTVAEVQATKGGPAVDSKSKPGFKVAILAIEAPAAKKFS